MANRIGSGGERRDDELMKDDIRIGYLGGVRYAVLTSEAEEMRKSPVVALSILMLIRGYITTIRTTNYPMALHYLPGIQWLSNPDPDLF